MPDSLHSLTYKSSGFDDKDASPSYAASYPLPVRQARALHSASFSFAVARNTFAVQLTLPFVGRVNVLYLQVSAPCRAHPKKQATEVAW